MPYRDFREFLWVLRDHRELIDVDRPFGEPFCEVADIPGWRDYAMPDLDAF